MEGKTTLKPPDRKSLDYDETLMYGKYSRDLGEFAKQEAARVKTKKAKERTDVFKAYSKGHCTDCKRKCYWFRDTVISKIGEDWLFLTLLGIFMALLSFGMDFVIEKCQTARRWLYEELEFSVTLQYFAWVIFPLLFICFSTGFVHLVGPNAIGSGIPEIKTIMRGVVLKEYLTFRTLVSKVVGLCTSLGCGLPIGKEGPFVHVASIVATILGKVFTSFRGIYENESRRTEMLSAACAVGVACTFAAPIGGVLFSIEVTATYFAVRNYWRGFYSAVCGAFVFRLLAVWFQDEETLTALFKTNLRTEFPFDPTELLAYAVVGIVCGFAGALFVFVHRRIVEFIRKQKKLTGFLQKNRFIFPSVVVLAISSLSFPPGLGKYMVGELTNHEAVNMLFSNFTWSTAGQGDTAAQQEILKFWLGPADSAFITLSLFCFMRFWMSALATTLPVPAGVFIPVFTMGAAFGRLVGESMAVWFPDGIGGSVVVPGGYAIVGAAALSGSVTHTVSTSVIVFELTGQMSHVLPCVIAVLISNAVAFHLQPSFYDMIIQLKGLPYFPDSLPPNSNAHRVFVEDLMVKRIKYVTLETTYKDAQALLDRYSFRSFPLVDSRQTMILLGSIQSNELQMAIDSYVQSATEAAAERRQSVGNHGDIPVTMVTPPTPTVERTVEGSKKMGRFSVSSEVGSPTENLNDLPSLHLPILQEDTDRGDIPQQDRPQIQSEDGRPVDLSTGLRQSVLQQPIDYDSCQIDPAPFQLVERTSLYKMINITLTMSAISVIAYLFSEFSAMLIRVHSLFSLLGLNHAYVTNMGRLVGIVSTKEVRNAVQGHVMPELQKSRTENSRNNREVIELEEQVSSSA